MNCVKGTLEPKEILANHSESGDNQKRLENVQDFGELCSENFRCYLCPGYGEKFQTPRLCDGGCGSSLSVVVTLVAAQALVKQSKKN